MTAPLGPQAQAAHRSIRRNVLGGLTLVMLLAGGVGGWASMTGLAGAVVASGAVVVDSNVKKVQHQAGGIVRNLHVRDGALVRAGDVLIRLDDTQTRANLAIIDKSLAELAARQSRLEAERDGAEVIDFEPLRQLGVGDNARIAQAERKLFEFRQAARIGQKSQLSERMSQLQEEIQGLTGQHAAKGQEFTLIQAELSGVRDLWRKNLISIQRVTALERDAARIDGERSTLLSNIAQTKGKITEIALQVLQIDQDLRSDVAKELREIQAKIAEYQERRTSAADLMQKIDIRSSQNGRVHQLAVHTVGGVIAPGETIMLIVPEEDRLTVEIRVPPREIDRVQHGQAAMLRFTAFNQRSTPQLRGEVALVSADVSQDQRSGTSFFGVRISVSDEEIARLNGQRLVPGMPVEGFIQTGERSVLSYLVKPLMDHAMRAFRER